MYSLQYHIVWCTKYRKPALKAEVKEICPAVSVYPGDIATPAGQAGKNLSFLQNSGSGMGTPDYARQSICSRHRNAASLRKPRRVPEVKKEKRKWAKKLSLLLKTAC